MTGGDDRYDVDAKVDEADLADWQNPAKQPAMLRSMLQAMLEDRLKLVVHRSTREAPVDLLVVGKNGPKFKETNPGDFILAHVRMPGVSHCEFVLSTSPLGDKLLEVFRIPPDKRDLRQKRSFVRNR